MQTKSIQINCPSCGHEFSPEAALEGHLRTHLEKEYAEKNSVNLKNAEAKAKAAADQEYQSKIKALELEASDKTKKLQDIEEQSLALAKKEKDLAEKMERADLDIQKQLLAQKETMKKDAEKFAFEKLSLEFQSREAALNQEKESLEVSIKREAILQVEKAREEEKMKYAELYKMYEDQKRMADEMQRKAQQNSMQIQGEVQELAIETYLANTFPKDEVEEISKGAKGADCLHIVKDQLGNECGRILYESKRTKSFSKDWIAKLKEDARLKQASLSVIVTEAMPGEMQRFGLVDGIWICSFAEFKSVSILLRDTMLRIGAVAATQVNKGEKMQLLYDYLTGNEFRQRVESISEAFTQMHTDLQKERAQAETNFGKREKQLQKVLINTSAMYGEVKGIAGGAVQVINSLEFPENNPPFLREAV